MSDDGAADALAALPSLGKVSARMLVEAGVLDLAALRRLGVVESYRRLRFRHGRRVTTTFIYALECAIAWIDWRALPEARKVELRAEAHAVNVALEEAASVPTAKFVSFCGGLRTNFAVERTLASP